VARVKLIAKLPDDDTDLNGLDVIYDEAMAAATAVAPKDHPGFLVVGVVKPSKYEVDVDRGGAKTPHLRFHAIEVVDGDRWDEAQRILDLAQRARTRQGTLPLFDRAEAGGATVHELRQERW
jgi:hypothetical protein